MCWGRPGKVSGDTYIYIIHWIRKQSESQLGTMQIQFTNKLKTIIIEA